MLFDEERPYEFIDLENGEKLKLNPARSKREIYPSIEFGALGIKNEMQPIED